MIYFVGHTNTESLTATIEEVVKYCEDKSVLAVDTETTGLDFLKDKMIMFQIGDDANQFIIDTRQVSIEPLRDILESETIVKVLHNVKFDYKFIRSAYNIELNNIWDTMIVDQVIHNGKNLRFRLVDLTERYLGIDVDKDVRTTFINMKDREFTYDQIIYGAKDVEHLITLREFQQANGIPANELEAAVELENKTALALADVEFNGIGLDTTMWSTLAAKSAERAKELGNKLDSYVLHIPELHQFKERYLQTDLFASVDTIRKVSVNWDSPSQVLKVFKVLVPGLEAVGAFELSNHKKIPLIRDYIKYKESMKLATSYGLDFLKNVGYDNRIHTSFSQILNTGRVASKKPNMQQIPGTNEFRNCFVSGLVDYQFVSSDYSSQELCIIAEGSQDPVWLQALRNGEDLHSICADLVYGQEWVDAAEQGCAYMSHKQKCNCPKHGKLRTNVKTVNFGLAYGMGPHKLANTLKISQEEAEELISKYFTIFPSIHKFLVSLGTYGTSHGHIKTFAPFKRIRWFDNWKPGLSQSKDGWKLLGTIERASKNTPIQGTGADMTKQALVYIHEYIKEHKVPVKVVMTVHDQIDTVCHTSYIDEWKEQMKVLMEQAARVILPSGLLKADTNISDKWEK
tara:strand:+ start:2173 stop:4056 length:1884 start_codon:yes stop_codon:yes gene_type:complete